MSALRDRVAAMEFDQWRKRYEDIFSRSDSDLEFYSVHGVFPEAATESVQREFEVEGWKTVVILTRCSDGK